MDDSTLIIGLLAKRSELQSINCELREKIAVVANDIEAVERVQDSLGYQGQAVTTPRAPRIVASRIEREPAHVERLGPQRLAV